MINWIKRLFSKRKITKLKPFLWYVFESVAEKRSMENYCVEQVLKDCGNDYITRLPSKALRYRYGLNRSECLIAWTILEDYFEGRLVKKENINKNI